MQLRLDSNAPHAWDLLFLINYPMKISKITAILLSLLLSAKAYAGPVEDGLAAYKEKNYTVAFEKFRLPAAQGNSFAQGSLGFMYEKGQGVVQDYAEAVKWYKLAAAQGNSLAQFRLGFMYGQGQGVVQDYAEAVKWYKLAAAQGISDAQLFLGFMYEKGQGVVQDYAEAVKLYKLAAAQGNSNAQGSLGVMYENGQGVVQDYAEAVKLYKLAAAQGNSVAQGSLGFMYEKGQGVVQDLMLAHMWFNLAAAQGEAIAKKTRDILASMLTPQQIAQAQNLARTCQSSKFTKCSNPYGAPVPKQAARPTQQPRTVYVPVPTPPIAKQYDPNDPFGLMDGMPEYLRPTPPKKSTTCRRNMFRDTVDEVTCTEN